eukprot:5271961-Amphidinium_carterae.1
MAQRIDAHRNSWPVLTLEDGWGYLRDYAPPEVEYDEQTRSFNVITEIWHPDIKLHYPKGH